MQDIERGVVVAVRACAALAARMPARREALVDQDAAARTGLRGVDRGTATTVFPVCAALKDRMAQNWPQPASSDLARWRPRTRLATCEDSWEIVSYARTRERAGLW